MSIISLPVAELKPALVGLGKIISKYPTLPIMDYLRLEITKDGWILATSTDLITFITVRFEQPTDEEPTSLLVPHADLVRLAKACDAKQFVTLEPAKDGKILVKYPIGNATGEEHLDGLPVADFPMPPKVKGEPIALDASLRKGLQQTFECASNDPTRYILNGAFIDVSQKDCHCIVGTDGRHLYSKNSFSLPLKDSLIVPLNKFLAWKEFGQDGEWKLKVDKERLEICSRRYRFTTKQVEGTYPNWRQVIPKESKTTIMLDESLMDIVPRLPVNIKDTNNAIGMRAERNKLSVLANGGEEAKPTEVEVQGARVKGNPVLFYLNRDFITKALKFGCNKLEVQDAESAMTFVGEGRKLVVMPVRAASPAPATSAPEPDEPKQPFGHAMPTPVTAPTKERTTPMVNQTNTDSSDANPEADPIEQSLELIEALKDSFQDSISNLKDLSSKLKAIQRERKTSTKEIQSFRNTIRSLQSLKI